MKFFLFLFLFFFIVADMATALDIPIFHADHRQTSSPSPLSSVLSLATGDISRIAFLSSAKQTNVPIASGQQTIQSSSYVLRAKLGNQTSPQLLLMAVDTSADAAWIPCSPCNTCPSTTLFVPANSSTYSAVPCSSSWCPLFKGQQCTADDTGGVAGTQACSYTQFYGGDSTSFTATLSQDTLGLAKDVIPNFMFGCVNAVNSGAGAGAVNLPKQGLLGLGRGPMSLMNQSGPVYQGIFSYCLPSFKSYYFSGSLRLGPAGQPVNAKWTTLLKNPHRSSLYYVNLTSVSVGRVQVLVPDGSFGFDPNTGSGTIVDSGTVITRFVAPAYVAIRDEFRRQVNASGGYSSLGAFDTCFNADEAAGAVPKVTLHMSEGLNLALPIENTLVHSSATPLACLAMAAAPDNVNAVVNVIASLQQQNLRVVIDVANSKVGFARELCN